VVWLPVEPELESRVVGSWQAAWAATTRSSPSTGDVMISAFGVDHGEISKARSPWLKGARGAKAARKAAAQQHPPVPSGPQKIAGKLNEIGEADISLKGIGRKSGQGVKNTGGFLERHPGLTGTALVGGGGAAGYTYLRNKQPKKKQS